jgi:hypothetical protein
MECPRCKGSKLKIKYYEGTEIDECGSCGGRWLDEGELRSILDARERIFTAEEVEQVKGVYRIVLLGREELKPELNCPRCGKSMQRFNYAATTGIILDRCRDCGIWFDKGELEHVQIFVEECERRLGADLAKYGPLLRKVGKELDERLERKDRFSAVRRLPLIGLVFSLFEEG